MSVGQVNDSGGALGWEIANREESRLNAPIPQNLNSENKNKISIKEEIDGCVTKGFKENSFSMFASRKESPSTDPALTLSSNANCSFQSDLYCDVSELEVRNFNDFLLPTPCKSSLTETSPSSENSFSIPSPIRSSASETSLSTPVAPIEFEFKVSDEWSGKASELLNKASEGKSSSRNFDNFKNRERLFSPSSEIQKPKRTEEQTRRKIQAEKIKSALLQSTPVFVENSSNDSLFSLTIPISPHLLTEERSQLRNLQRLKSIQYQTRQEETRDENTQYPHLKERGEYSLTVPTNIYLRTEERSRIRALSNVSVTIQPEIEPIAPFRKRDYTELTVPKEIHLQTEERSLIHKQIQQEKSIRIFGSSELPNGNLFTKKTQAEIDSWREHVAAYRSESGTTVSEDVHLFTEDRSRIRQINTNTFVSEDDIELAKPFRATPLDRRIFDSVGDMGITRVTKAPLTVPLAPPLLTEMRAEVKKEAVVSAGGIFSSVYCPSIPHNITAAPLLNEATFSGIFSRPRPAFAFDLFSPSSYIPFEQAKPAPHEFCLTIPQSPQLLTRDRALLRTLRQENSISSASYMASIDSHEPEDRQCQRSARTFTQQPLTSKLVPTTFKPLEELAPVKNTVLPNPLLASAPLPNIVGSLLNARFSNLNITQTAVPQPLISKPQASLTSKLAAVLNSANDQENSGLQTRPPSATTASYQPVGASSALPTSRIFSAFCAVPLPTSSTSLLNGSGLLNRGRE